MGIFSKKTTKTVKVVNKTVKTEKAVAMPQLGERFDASSIIVRPRITEKAGLMSEASNVYTFEIKKNATKGQVKNALQVIYKVRPIRVNVVNLPSKNVFVRGKRGTVKGVKKALVTLRKGEKIEFI